MFNKPSSKVNQWFQNRRRPMSAYYPSISTTATSSTKAEIPSNNTSDTQQDHHPARRALSLQQQHSRSEHSHTRSQPPAPEPLTIPKRDTSKHYRLDPALQARVDRVLENEQIKQLQRRLQGRAKRPASAPPPPVPPHNYVC